MHFDFGWPKQLIGSQSKRDWAFDVLGRDVQSESSLRVAGEVKKSSREIDALIGHMQGCGQQAPTSSEPLIALWLHPFDWIGPGLALQPLHLLQGILQ